MFAKSYRITSGHHSSAAYSPMLRCVELYKAPDATAISAARALLDRMDHLSHRMGVTQLFTAPYSHQEYGIAKRAHK